MITAVFTSGFDHTEVSGLWQYDYGQKLRIQGLNLPPAVEIHFSLSKSGGDSESRVGVTRDGVTDVPIPDSMLENGGTIQNYYIYAFIYLTDEASGKTVKWIQLHVNSRPKPEAFDSPEEKELFREAIAAVNDSADRAETAEKSSEAWAHGHEDYPERDEDNAKFYSDKAGEKAEETASNLQEVNNLANQVKENAETVASDKNAVEEFKNKAGESAENAAVSESNAALHENNAKEAQTKAEAAQRAVEEAKKQVEKDKEEVLLAETAVEESEANVAGNKEYVRQTVENFTSLAENAVDAVNTAGQNQVNNIEEAGQAALDNISNGVDESLTQSGKAADAKVTGEKFTGLEHDVEELDNKKITKFYASNIGNTNLQDSDFGKITDMMLYGKSEQFQGEIEIEDGTTVTVPCLDYPQEIKSVVNPVVKVCGKNLIDIDSIDDLHITNNGATNFYKIKVLPNTNYTMSSDVPKTNPATIYFGGISSAYNQVSKKESKTVMSDNDGYLVFYIRIDMQSGYTIEDLKNRNYYIQLEQGSVATDYELYKEQTVTLPYELNAIPVSCGGNVTIDGQQYLADYVDVEKKQLVRNVHKVTVTSDLLDYYGKATYGRTYVAINKSYTNKEIYDSTLFPLSKNSTWGGKAYAICSKVKKIICGDVSIESNGLAMFIHIFESRGIIIASNDELTLEEFKEMCPFDIYYALREPKIIDLTDEEVQSFKDLSTYYPTTNVFITSDKLEGYTEFNYPLNMKNGWDYVMSQIGETREFRYDTEVNVLENKIDTAILTAMMEG